MSTRDHPCFGNILSMPVTPRVPAPRRLQPVEEKPVLKAEDFRQGEVIKSVLSTEDRKKGPKHLFAIPEKAPGPGSYPLFGPDGKPDIKHARDALARCANKSPDIQRRVRAAVYRHFPELKGVGKGWVDTPKADRMGPEFRHAHLIDFPIPRD